MEELIVKYLTDTLTAAENARFRALESSDASFASELRGCLTEKDDLTCKLLEFTGQ